MEMFNFNKSSHNQTLSFIRIQKRERRKGGDNKAENYSSILFRLKSISRKLRFPNIQQHFFYRVTLIRVRLLILKRERTLL